MDALFVFPRLLVRTTVGKGSVLSREAFSFGGYLAALYGSKHREIERMVLLAPAFGFGERWAEIFGEKEVAEWRSRGSCDVFHYASGGTRRLSADLLTDSLLHPGYP